MSNWCWSGIEASFDDKKDAVRVTSILDNMRMEADKENRGMDLGMVDNWLFDVQEPPRVEEHHVWIQGEVRWGFDPNQIRGLCKWFFDRGASKVTCSYEEISNLILGEWVSDKDTGIITDKYVNPDSPAWNAYHEGDIGMEELEDEDKDVRTFSMEVKNERDMDQS